MRILIMTFAASLMLFSCGSNENTEENKEMKEEIIQLDSINKDLETTKEEIETTTEEVENLLEEL